MIPKPKGELAIKTLARFSDTNANGDIFGGWLVSQMDIAGSIIARQRSKSRITTVAIDAMVFHKPVQVSDLLCCYADITKIGRTSMKIHIEAWVIDHITNHNIKVTEGFFTFVAINSLGRPIPVDKEES